MNKNEYFSSEIKTLVPNVDSFQFISLLPARVARSLSRYVSIIASLLTIFTYFFFLFNQFQNQRSN
jgi:hypothetical protein